MEATARSCSPLIQIGSGIDNRNVLKLGGNFPNIYSRPFEWLDNPTHPTLRIEALFIVANPANAVKLAGKLT
jgi:hypothetical protein